jgi:hypothetical protein
MTTDRAPIPPVVRLARRVADAIDARDVFVFGGLLVAAAGGWQLSPPCTLVGLGLAFAALGRFTGGR